MPKYATELTRLNVSFATTQCANSQTVDIVRMIVPAVGMASVKRLRVSVVQVSSAILVLVVGCLVMEVTPERRRRAANAFLDGQVWIAHEVSATHTCTQTQTHAHACAYVGTLPSVTWVMQ